MGEHGSLGQSGSSAGELEVANLMGHHLAHGLAKGVGVLPAPRFDELVVRLVGA